MTRGRIAQFRVADAMVSVPAHTVSVKLGIYMAPPFQGPFQCFYDQYAGAFPNHKPIPVAVKRPGGFFGLIGAGGQGFHGTKPGNAGWGNDGLGTSGDHGDHC